MARNTGLYTDDALESRFAPNDGRIRMSLDCHGDWQRNGLGAAMAVQIAWVASSP